MVLISTEDEEPYLPMNGGRCYLTGRDRLNRTGHNDIEVEEGWCTGMFCEGFWSLIYNVLVFLRRTSIRTTTRLRRTSSSRCSAWTKRIIRRILLFSYSGTWGMKDVDMGSSHRIHYYTYSISSTDNRKVAVVFLYGAKSAVLKTPMPHSEQKKRVSRYRRKQCNQYGR